MKNATMLLVVFLAGCAGTRDAGVVSISAIDPMGRNPGSFNFAVIDEETGKSVWSGIPAEGSTVRNTVKGGEYRLLVVSSAGAAVQDLDVNGDETVTVRLSTGGAARGEARLAGKPFAAEVWMPIPGRGPEKSGALSYITRANADGHFQIDRLPPGHWSLYVGNSVDGYKLVDVDIVEGKVAQLGYVDVR